MVSIALALVSCGETVTTRVVPVAQPLPQQEEVRYKLLDVNGAEVGTAVLSIAPEGEHARLGLSYDFGPGRMDGSTTLVRRDSMKPLRSERTVIDGDRRYVTTSEYGDKVTVTLDDGQRNRRRDATLSESAYDNLESLFLWRTIDLSVGTDIRYGNVIVDPKRGTISRAVASIEVIGREEVRLPSGPVQAWRLQFRSAGISNTAWYLAEGTHPLVRYEITRGPTLVIESLPR